MNVKIPSTTYATTIAIEAWSTRSSASVISVRLGCPPSISSSATSMYWPSAEMLLSSVSEIRISPTIATVRSVCRRRGGSAGFAIRWPSATW